MTCCIDKLIKSPLSMEKFAKKVASLTPSGFLVCLQGPLGSGKSVFVRGFARFFGIKDHILSPTFTLLQEYTSCIPESPVKNVYHFDLYRLSSFEEFDLIGGSEIVYSPDSISLIEWPEIISDFLIPQNTIKVDIKVCDNPLHRNVRVTFPFSL